MRGVVLHWMTEKEANKDPCMEAWLWKTQALRSNLQADAWLWKTQALRSVNVLEARQNWVGLARPCTTALGSITMLCQNCTPCCETTALYYAQVQKEEIESLVLKFEACALLTT